MSHIEELRKKRGLNQRAFGNLFYISQQTVSRIEKDPSTISADTLIKLSENFNVTTDYLLELTDEKRNFLRDCKVSQKIEQYYEFIVEYGELTQDNQEVVLFIVQGLKQSQNKKRGDT